MFFNTYDYKIDKEKKIGEGSFGIVYEATCLSDNKKYAVKIIKTDNKFNGNEQMTFMRESMILHKLSHPSI